MNENKQILICEDSMDGIFTAVYDGWMVNAAGMDVEIRTKNPDNLELFCTYQEITKDLEKSVKVAGSIRRKLGIQTYESICYAAVSTCPDKGTAIFRVLRQALGKGHCNARIMEALADPDVNLVSKLQIKVWHEFHRYFGFLRFRELEGGILFAKISPENDILAMLGPHFQNRYPNENWMIYDEARHKVLLHQKGQACTLRINTVLNESQREELAKPENYEQLWQTFCQSVTIQERKNQKLQQQFVPLKFRPNMLEFH